MRDFDISTLWMVGIILLIVLLSMVAHELMHGLVAYLLGDNTAKEEGRLSLNPLKHLDPINSVALPVVLFLLGGPVFGGAKPVPINSRNLKWGEWGMALVAVVGPLTNLVLAFISFLIGHFTGLLYDGGVWQFVFTEMVLVNLGFMVFNLIPIPPLDGSRVLYAIAPDGARAVMERFEQGVGLLGVLILVMFFGTAFSTVMGGAIRGILQGFYFLVGM